jgi:uncharacterized protein (TIGR02284 family)
MENTEVICTLSELIQACTDSHDAFHHAADNVKNSEFRRLFSIFSHQRTQFVSELQAEINRLGGGENTTGTEKRGNIYQMKPQAPLQMVDAGASIVAQCQEFEEAAVNSYQAALKADLPLDVQYVVKRQYMDIKDAYDRIRILQRAA